MISTPSATDKNATQKLIAYSLIGYLQVLSQHDYSEVDINFVFQPEVTARRMKELGHDSRLIGVMLEIDELEALKRAIDSNAFNLVVSEIGRTLSRIIVELRVSDYNSRASMKDLLPRAT